MSLEHIAPGVFFSYSAICSGYPRQTMTSPHISRSAAHKAWHCALLPWHHQRHLHLADNGVWACKMGFSFVEVISSVMGTQWFLCAMPVQCYKCQGLNEWSVKLNRHKTQAPASKGFCMWRLYVTRSKRSFVLFFLSGKEHSRGVIILNCFHAPIIFFPSLYSMQLI